MGGENERKVNLGEELSNGSHSVSCTKSINDMGHVQDGKKNKKKSRKSQRKEKRGIDETTIEHAVPCNDSTDEGKSDIPIAEASNIKDESDMSNNDTHNANGTYSFDNVPNGLQRDGLENVEFSEAAVLKFIRTIALSIASHLANGWRGINLHFSLLKIIAAAIGKFLGFTFAVLLIGFAGILFLWFYGSFWTTGLIIFLGGLSFALSHDRIALFIASIYSAYCAWNYVGWLGLVFGLNLSFISSDALLFFMRNFINEQTGASSSPEQSAGMQSQPSFSHDECGQASSTETGAAGQQADRSQGVPSTSGTGCEMTSEDEVVRKKVRVSDITLLDMAMLVHPDKNMGNEKAAEAFKKLQNAYEVLLDSFKRKEYDDELRREELLNYLRKFQNASRENKGHGLFSSSFAHTNGDGKDPPGESRRIACRKWAFTMSGFVPRNRSPEQDGARNARTFIRPKTGMDGLSSHHNPSSLGYYKRLKLPPHIYVWMARYMMQLNGIFVRE
ncbi:UNVERIFIED_CONTAM: hypothetical protein Scaly_2745100 [Sesamum calycinum]|uniref:J domain-containing protein n=1 Tax=Sesamum calycinum TaxID=2727403 RepID=A0AAW2J267_9LAMI